MADGDLCYPAVMAALQVLETFQLGGNSEHGFSVDEVAARLASRGVPSAEVKRAAEYLSLEGHLYATKDEVRVCACTQPQRKLL